MPPSSPQFTPAQVLQAGRRAESDGRDDLAEHFYRHVVEHYGATVEASAAREGLVRLQGRIGGSPVVASATPVISRPYPPPPLPERTLQERLETAPVAATVAPAQPAAPEPEAAIAPVEVAPEPASALPRIEAAADRLLDVRHPIASTTRRYRIGRAAAALAGFVGWVMFVAGLAIVPLAMTKQVAEAIPQLASPAGLAATVGWAVAQIVGGIAIVVLAQVARAVFDIAEDGSPGRPPPDRRSH